MKKTLIVAALLFSSCSVMVKTPLSRFESPETRGKSGGVDAYLGYQGRNEMELTPSIATRAPDLTHPSSESPGHRLIANGSVGLAERFDLSLTLPEARLGAKYQLLGNPHESAEAGNIPLAVSTSIAAMSEEETAYGTIKLKELVYDLALISGYRINALWMIYGGPYILRDDLKTNYASPVVAPVEKKGKLTSIGANLGIEYSFSNGFLRAEFSGARTKLGATNVGRGTYGFVVGARF